MVNKLANIHTQSHVILSKTSSLQNLPEASFQNQILTPYVNQDGTTSTLLALGNLA